MNASPRQGLRAFDVLERAGSDLGTDDLTPEVLVLAPPPLGELYPEGRAERFAGGVEKTHALPEHDQTIAEAADAEFLDVGTLAETDGIDGLHLSDGAHENIGRGVAEKVRAIPE
ncbi:SGNH/GDSL hydrolase family protein [Paracoccus liaowanqingii]|nr:hypothetical protein [Paracoccus liaowanqingii]